jgi:hypothetical protein
MNGRSLANKTPLMPSLLAMPGISGSPLQGDTLRLGVLFGGESPVQFFHPSLVARQAVHNMTIPLCLLARSLASKPGMSAGLHCAEFQRLKCEYERSLRIWARFAFPLPSDALQFPWRLPQLKYEAQLARDLAGKRMSAHQENCALCKFG